jgi:hypothetical protein
MKPAKYPQLSRAKFGMDMEEEASSLLAKEHRRSPSLRLAWRSWMRALQSATYPRPGIGFVRVPPGRSGKPAHVACVIQAEGYT